MKNSCLTMYLVSALVLIAGTAKAVACIPGNIRTPETSANVVEGRVLASYGQIYGVPVPLTIAYLSSMFGDVGEGVAVVFVDRMIKGTSPRIVNVSQGLYGIGLRCRGEMPSMYDKVLLFGDSNLMSGNFRSFFGPSGFHAGSLADYNEMMSRRSNF
ncbi:hypothetical protein FHT76_001540 [Rhizobium sp. BK176]|nr:hypothetical protein [Rhizobium sp. BK176]